MNTVRVRSIFLRKLYIEILKKMFILLFSEQWRVSLVEYSDGRIDLVDRNLLGNRAFVRMDVRPIELFNCKNI